MKQIVLVLALVCGATFIGLKEVTFYTDVFAVGEELNQMDIDQMTRRVDMTPEEIVKRVKYKAAQLQFEVKHLEVTRSAQIPQTPPAGAKEASPLHQYSVHGVLTRKVLFDHLQEGTINHSWATRCPVGVGAGGDDETKDLTVIEPPADSEAAPAQ